MKLIGYNDSPIKNLGFIIVFLYHGNEKFNVLSKVADSSSHIILAREQALRMKYVDFPLIQVPTINEKPGKTIKAVQKEQVKAATEPVIKRSTGNSITINGKTHQLSTTKGCLLKEYADVFKGI